MLGKKKDLREAIPSSVTVGALTRGSGRRSFHGVSGLMYLCFNTYHASCCMLNNWQPYGCCCAASRQQPWRLEVQLSECGQRQGAPTLLPDVACILFTSVESRRTTHVYCLAAVTKKHERPCVCSVSCFRSSSNRNEVYGYTASSSSAVVGRKHWG